jgi:hypothetical protein
VKDLRTTTVIISVSAVAIILAMIVTVANPSQDLSFAFGEPREFERHLTSCLKKSDNVVNCLPVTISPSSGALGNTPQVQPPSSGALGNTPQVQPINTADQLSLLQRCISDGACTPTISFPQRDVFQVPFKPLQLREVILEVRPDLVPVTDIRSLANDIAARYNLVILDIVDITGYKAIIIQAPAVNNPVFSDTRFVDYNAPTNAGVGEMNGVSGHITQLKWNQTIPYGIKRTIPIANVTSQGGNSNITGANAASPVENTAAQTGIAALNASGQPSNAAINKERMVDVDIAVLDTGISLSHPDLNVYRNVSFVKNVISGNDPIGHGSHVAGIAAARDNAVGIVGVAPGARLWAIQVCDNFGECKISNQIKGIEYAIRHADEIDVLNISVENPNSPALNSIISAATRAGITVVVSAGNYGRDASTTTPANNPDVITVSAIGDSDGKCGGQGPPMTLSDRRLPDDTFAYFSNFGPAVKMAAPGVNIFSTYNGSGYAVDSGTSMAAPYITGAAALYKSEFPDASPAEVIANVTASGSLPITVCDGGAHGYFSGDLDKINEPLLFRESAPAR